MAKKKLDTSNMTELQHKQAKTDLNLTVGKRKSIKREFTDWLYQKYNITFAPKHFFIQLNNVYKGTYKGLNCPVPVEDLWEMWQRKWNYLEKQHIKNEINNKHIDGVNRIWYDLSILLSKYESYLDWKAEHLAEIKEMYKVKDDEKIEYNNLKENTSTDANGSKYQNSDEFDLDSFLDETYDK